VTSTVPVRLTSAPVRVDDATLGSDDRLVDRFGRVHRDLRISVTDRCNLRCVYCMPEDGVVFLPRTQILTYEELARVARVAHGLGAERVRITGGEPMVRRGLETFIGLLSDIGFADLSMTTNGTGMERRATGLAAAGLRRVNISCDSLRRDRFGEIRRGGDLDTALHAMDAAEAAGLSPVKVNVVVLAGVNEDEVVDFARFARDTGRQVRFIEYMPLDGAGEWDRDSVVPAARILETIASHWPLEPMSPAAADPNAPATTFRFTDGNGEVGIIPTVTEPFCGTCDRLRVTADGAIRNCLFATQETPLRAVLRDGSGDEAIALALRRAVAGKLPGHGINDPGFLRPARSMSMIGG